MNILGKINMSLSVRKAMVKNVCNSNIQRANGFINGWKPRNADVINAIRDSAVSHVTK